MLHIVLWLPRVPFPSVGQFPVPSSPRPLQPGSSLHDLLPVKNTNPQQGNLSFSRMSELCFFSSWRRKKRRQEYKGKNVHQSCLMFQTRVICQIPVGSHVLGENGVLIIWICVSRALCRRHLALESALYWTVDMDARLSDFSRCYFNYYLFLICWNNVLQIINLKQEGKKTKKGWGGGRWGNATRVWYRSWYLNNCIQR